MSTLKPGDNVVIDNPLPENADRQGHAGKVKALVPLGRGDMVDVELTDSNVTVRLHELEVSKPKYTRTHMSVDVNGALRNWKASNWKGVCTDPETGRTMTTAEVKAGLKDHQAKGHKVIPCCSDAECPDFDYFEHGCPGHPSEGPAQ